MLSLVDKLPAEVCRVRIAVPAPWGYDHSNARRQHATAGRQVRRREENEAMAHDPHPHLTCRWEKPVDWDLLDILSVPDEPGFYVFTDYGEAMLQPTLGGQSVLYVGIATGSLR